MTSHADGQANFVVRSQACDVRCYVMKSDCEAHFGRIAPSQVRVWLVILILGAILNASVGCNRTPVAADQMLVGYTMGTTYSVKFRPTEDVELSHIAAQVEQELTAVNLQMSTYIDDSELQKFNDSTVTGQWMAVSKETAETVELALAISEKTNGAFDVTVGPLVNLWGFGPEGKPNKIPSDSAIQSAAKSVGYHKLETRVDPPALRKSDSRVQADLSSIAKGHGVDRVAELLEAMNIDSYLVEVGGEVRAKGTRSDGKVWRLGIESPVEDERNLYAAIELTDVSLATSGDYRNHYELDGQRFSHTIDPRTGMPSQDPIVSASVVMPTCAEADGIATGMMALGFEKGIEVANRNEWPVLLLARIDDEIQMAQSDAFREQFPDFAPLDRSQND